jgi:hypothetical protein
MTSSLPELFDGAFSTYPWWDAIRVFNAIVGLTAAAWFARILLTSPPRDNGFRLRMLALVLCTVTLSLGALHRLNGAPTPLAILQAVATVIAGVAAWESSSGRRGAEEDAQFIGLSAQSLRGRLGGGSIGSRKPPGHVQDDVAQAQAEAELSRDSRGPLG